MSKITLLAGAGVMIVIGLIGMFTESGDAYNSWVCAGLTLMWIGLSVK